MIQVTEEQRRSVEALLRRSELSPRQRERLEMVKAVRLGQEIEAIVQWTGRRARTVRLWLQRCAAGGPAALRDAPRSGRPVQADAAYLQALAAALATTPAALGLPYAVWTSARLTAYLAERTGVQLAPSWLRTLLKRRDYVHGRPKHPRNHLQDPVATAACADLLAVVEKQGGGGAGALRTALPGRTPWRDEPVAVQGLAAAGSPADPAGRRHQSAGHGVWQR
jgi:transposase